MRQKNKTTKITNTICSLILSATLSSCVKKEPPKTPQPEREVFPCERTVDGFIARYEDEFGKKSSISYQVSPDDESIGKISAKIAYSQTGFIDMEVTSTKYGPRRIKYHFEVIKIEKVGLECGNREGLEHCTAPVIDKATTELIKIIYKSNFNKCIKMF